MKSTQSYIKAWQAWKKARAEGRCAKAKVDPKSPCQKFQDAAIALERCHVGTPEWGQAALISIGIDAALAVEAYGDALACIQVSTLKKQVTSDDVKIRERIESWAGDIIIGTMQGKELPVAQTRLQVVLEHLSGTASQGYLTDNLAEDITLLKCFSSPGKQDCKVLLECTQGIAKKKLAKCQFWLLFLDHPLAKSMLRGIEEESKVAEYEDAQVSALAKLKDTYVKLRGSLQNPDVDFANLFSLIKVQAPLLVTHIKSLALEAKRSKFLESRSVEVKGVLQILVELLLDLDESWVHKEWMGCVTDEAKWRGPHLNVIKLNMERLAWLANMFRRLDGLEFGSQLKKGELLGGTLFTVKRLQTLLEDLGFRSVTALLMEETLKVQESVPLPADESTELPPELFSKLVNMCRALTQFDETALKMGVPGELGSSSQEEKLFNLVEQGPKQLAKCWVARIIAEKNATFQRNLCKSLFPVEAQDKFLPPGLSEEILLKCANVPESGFDTLAVLYTVLDMYAERDQCLLEGRISNMQVWASKLMVALTKMSPLATLTLKTLSVESGVYAPLMALKSDIKDAEDMRKGASMELRAVVDEAAAFYTEKVQDLETRLTRLVTYANKECKGLTPEWRSFVLANRDEKKIKEFMAGPACGIIRSGYPLLSALEQDVEACDADLELHLKFKAKEPMQSLAKGLVELKLILGVEHTLRVLYLQAPAAKTGKARAGLVRELKGKLSKSGVSSIMPSELMAKLNDL